LHKQTRISRLLIYKCRICNSKDFLLKYILEDSIRDSNIERLLKGLKEIIHSTGKWQVSGKSRGLCGEALSTIKHTKTGIRNKGEEDLRGYISGLVEVNKETYA